MVEIRCNTHGNYSSYIANGISLKIGDFRDLKSWRERWFKNIDPDTKYHFFLGGCSVVLNGKTLTNVLLQIDAILSSVSEETSIPEPVAELVNDVA